MSFVNLSPDVIVLGIAVTVILYGLLFGHHKIKMLALSIYVGLFLAQELGPVIQGFISGHATSYSGLASLSTVEMVLFVMSLVLFGLSQLPLRASAAKRGMFTTLILSVLTAGLLISSGLSLLTSGERGQILSQSFVSLNIYQFHLWWVALVPLAIVLSLFNKHKPSRRHE